MLFQSALAQTPQLGVRSTGLTMTFHLHRAPAQEENCCPALSYPRLSLHLSGIWELRTTFSTELDYEHEQAAIAPSDKGAEIPS